MWDMKKWLEHNLGISMEGNKLCGYVMFVTTEHRALATKVTVTTSG